jgi:hypothetical protein
MSDMSDLEYRANNRNKQREAKKTKKKKQGTKFGTMRGGGGG